MAESPGLKEAEERRERATVAYRAIVQAPGWPYVLQDLLGASTPRLCPDPQVRCGRLDLIAHILRAAGTTGPLQEPVNG